MRPSAVYDRRWRRANPKRSNASRRQWAKANPEKVRVSNVVWRAANPDKMWAQRRRYRKAHPRRVKVANRRWRRANPAQFLVSNARWRHAHPEYIRSYAPQYRRANPDKLREAARRRRALKYHAEGDHSAAEWLALCDLYGGHCLCCNRTRRKLTEDHIIALSVGGSDWLSNIQPLCGSCNSGKGTKDTDYRPWKWSALLRESRKSTEKKEKRV
jgi:5-methylcytosine-specific restriction endonuclease McrA